MVTIAHLSDLHFGDACPRALSAAHEALQAAQPDCIVVTGDITQAGRRTEFKAAKDWFTTLESPLVVCPGNHDAPVYSILSRIAHPYQRFKNMDLPDRWADQHARACVVSWNSARAIQARLDWSQGVHAPSEVDKALQTASALAPQGWRILACHHPPGPPANAPIVVRTKHAATTRRRLESARRTLLLCGHVHQFSQEAVGEAIVVTAPTLSSSRERASGQGFVLLQLSEGGAKIDRVAL